MTQVTQNEWARCPAGELGRLAGRLRGRRLRGILLAAAGALVAAGGIAYGAVHLVGALGSGTPPAACPTVPGSCTPTPASAPCPTTTP